jgi:MFS family permease
VAQSALALVAGLPAGVLADRLDRRRLAVSSDLSQAVVFVVVAMAVVVGQASIPLLYAAALLLGAAAMVGDTAMATAVPALIPTPQLEHANGRLVSVVFMGQQLTGPAVGAGLFALAVASPFTLSAGLAAVSAAALTRLPSLNRSPPSAHRSR